VTLAEWGSLTPAAVAPLYRREQQRWLDALSWDTSATWSTIESARVSWGLPGFVCRDHTGDVRGWTYFLKQDGAIDVGGIVADTEAATSAVIEGLSAAGPSLGGFVYATAPGLADGLAKRGILTERYAYLIRSTSRCTSCIPCTSYTPRAWRLEDAAGTASLLQAAYGAAGHLFARHNRAEEWSSYVDSLVAHPGCGVLQPQLSIVVERDGIIGGVALVTALSPDTAHLAQLAVAPAISRAGVGRQLVHEVIAAAGRAGYRGVSLLVSLENPRACALYHSFAFVPCGEFLALRGRESM
jgi:ribosomal protein S18 acetylase RimI-like enzyme